MQQLLLHPKWESAICEQDRIEIERLFDRTSLINEDILTTPIYRVAFNYKHQLLVTVLIHNFKHRSISFNNKLCSITDQNLWIEQRFHYENLSIPPFTSMPWTFIFDSSEVEQLKINNLIFEID